MSFDTHKQVIDFIRGQFIAVLAVEMMDGSPHGATVHFAFHEDTGRFFFETYRPYRKCEALFGREKSRATLVVGFDENNRKTLQMDGEVQILQNDDDRLLFNKIYFKKFPNKKSDDPKFVFFSFTPKWWRYTDWETSSGKMIICSEDNK